MQAWLVVVLSLTAVVWGAPFAHADPNDEQFLNTLTLQRDGLHPNLVSQLWAKR